MKFKLTLNDYRFFANCDAIHHFFSAAIVCRRLALLLWRHSHVPHLVHVTSHGLFRRARHIRQVEDVRSNEFFVIAHVEGNLASSYCAYRIIFLWGLILILVFQIIMSTSLFSAWRKNIFSSPFHASCDDGEAAEAEPLAVNEERTIAAASSGLLLFHFKSRFKKNIHC